MKQKILKSENKIKACKFCGLPIQKNAFCSVQCRENFYKLKFASGFYQPKKHVLRISRNVFENEKVRDVFANE